MENLEKKTGVEEQETPETKVTKNTEIQLEINFEDAQEDPVEERTEKDENDTPKHEDKDPNQDNLYHFDPDEEPYWNR
ncbi:hypothetical protein J5751_04175 [bacterium]|nr:hypothetical protein [bacterium]